MCEANTQKRLVAWYRERGLTVVSPNNSWAVFHDAQTRSYADDLGLCKGAADLFIPKYKLWLELKHGNNELGKSQREFRSEMLALGYSYMVVRSLREGMQIILAYEREASLAS